jgi:hypothetical protein
MKRGIVWAVLLAVGGMGGVWSVSAASFNSSNFSINGNIGDSAAGAQSSTNYQLTSAAGESIAGQSSSTSYKLGQGYIPTLENSMQVITQPNGLSGYWPLDNAAAGATAFDESANANNGTYSAGTASYPGKVNGSWSETSGTATTSIPHSASMPSGNAMTVSGWIYKSSALNQHAIMSKWDFGASNGTWALQLVDGSNLRAFIRSGPGDSGDNYVDSTNANLAAGTWYHVAMVYDGTQSAADRVKLFVNGVQLSTTVGGTIPSTLFASTTPLVIGDFPGLSRYWSGALDEVKLYSRALNESDIKAEYDAGVAGVPAGVGLGAITPGTAQTAAFDSIVQTSAGGYSLAINQTSNFTNGAATIPAVSGSIGAPVAWNDGTTKGLGFTLFGTNATAIPGLWGSGANYAALPGTATTFYSRTGPTGGSKDVVNMRLRADVSTSQPAGNYSNQMIITGTMIP